MPVLVNNLQEETTVDEEMAAFLAGVAGAVLESEGYGQEAEVSLVLVDDEYIQSLNYQYRGVDSPTDVLSFAMLEGEDMPSVQEEGLILGDVVISLPAARRQAEEYGHSFRREIAFLTVHGVLHLLGYDHLDDAQQKKMRLKEEQILTSLDLPR